MYSRGWGECERSRVHNEGRLAEAGESSIILRGKGETESNVSNLIAIYNKQSSTYLPPTLA